MTDPTNIDLSTALIGSRWKRRDGVVVKLAERINDSWWRFDDGGSRTQTGAWNAKEKPHPLDVVVAPAPEPAAVAPLGTPPLRSIWRHRETGEVREIYSKSSAGWTGWLACPYRTRDGYYAPAVAAVSPESPWAKWDQWAAGADCIYDPRPEDVYLGAIKTDTTNVMPTADIDPLVRDLAVAFAPAVYAEATNHDMGWAEVASDIAGHAIATAAELRRRTGK